MTPARMPANGERGSDEQPTKANIDACRRCELGEFATQGVIGEGADGARLMLVGEQPGHEEDLAGRPFVGPAGQLLRALLEEAGIRAADIFITNAVKHFYFVQRGKRRLHKTPLQRHVAACHDWLEREMARIEPGVIVTLGATALAAVCGTRVAIAAARNRDLRTASGLPIVATYHPSAVLRVPDEHARAQMRAALLADLRRAARASTADA
jgi:uracil-DNA glycosylase family protein